MARRPRPDAHEPADVTSVPPRQPEETSTLAGKNKGGREARKPKQDQNKKVSGQTPNPVSKALAPADVSGGRSSR
jgi:hypothetical protein